MQTNKIKSINITLSTLLISVFFVLTRTALLIFGYDFELNFFKNQNTAYILFLLFVVFLFAIILSKKLFTTTNTQNSAGMFSKSIYILLTLVFALLFILYTKQTFDYVKTPIYEKNALKTVTSYLLPPLSIISAIFTFQKSREKSSETLTSILAIFAVLFFGVVLIEKFARISATSMSLYLFPDVAAILCMAYFMLISGKEALGQKSETPVFHLASFFVLTFSTLPDLLMSALAKSPLPDVKDTLFIILKILFILLTSSNIISFIKSQKD